MLSVSPPPSGARTSDSMWPWRPTTSADNTLRLISMEVRPHFYGYHVLNLAPSNCKVMNRGVLCVAVAVLYKCSCPHDYYKLLEVTC
jgi:hypothetical protein